ncbi:2'-5' RNA ligase [Carboxydothermus islandicus]|uniref:RNA 2',3'-cyclic phosphodiesterase n=1 Tax=Carboxydothermus islandicus TaxID=661089 RepID=A0A1L8D2U3_9THEO|nr:RNA 2',3'-cyclic phosphodiesterase [Carboxydothermus islandicus]GAV25505.1 2'-5' RNA ligase [Carboxydothermus islandicus]
MRLFFAVDFPGELKEEIYQDITPLFKYNGVKWVAKENYHLTLAFLGEKEEGELPQIDRAAKSVPQVNKSLIKVLDFGAFPNLKKPKVLFLKIESPGLLTLAENLRQNLKENNISFDEKPFVPHLTIGRVKEEIKDLALPKFNPKEFSFKNFYLIKSILTPEGPIYEKIKSYEILQNA